MVRAYIGLGSNLDEPINQVNRALTELRTLSESHLVSHSRLYSSTPLGPADQPDFVNAVACLDTSLGAHSLLDELQALELKHERVRIQHWGPRSLDLDLLLYADHTIDTERLQVPHPWLSQRCFVLYPLAEIAADLMLPSGISLASLLPLCDATGLETLA